MDPARAVIQPRPTTARKTLLLLTTCRSVSLDYITTSLVGKQKTYFPSPPSKKRLDDCSQNTGWYGYDRIDGRELVEGIEVGRLYTAPKVHFVDCAIEEPMLANGLQPRSKVHLEHPQVRTTTTKLRVHTAHVTRRVRRVKAEVFGCRCVMAA